MQQEPDVPAPVAGGLRHHPDGRARCGWGGPDPDLLAYHDQEWGRPVRAEQPLFEKLCLEAFQSGLSWLTILRKRAAFRRAFAGFDPEHLAGFGPAKVERLLADPAIVRNRAKIEATITNAQALCRLHDRGEDLTSLVWAHAPPPAPRPRSLAEVPTRTAASEALAATLRREGFRFVGPTTAYAFLQAMGLVDDHLEGCWVPPEATGPTA
ncbi:MAG: DNA-3-methyladenine glycosylase I [Nitriliruptoraceae bacterium]